MTYSVAWATLSARVRGLVQAGHLHADLLKVNTADSYGRWRHLRIQCAQVLNSLENFRTRFSASLPLEAAKSIDDFVKERKELIAANIDPTMGPEATLAGLVFLAALETELSFLLADTQQVIRARSERAFVHLQRSIVAYSDFRAKWRTALDSGELSCEKLGGVHLLSHGIFAFKVSETGERTDLVFNEPLEDIDPLQRYADGLVLTEWKVAKPDATATERLAQARTQAQRYARGVLGGMELTTYRYLVIVSEDYVAGIPSENRDGDVIYRHINIAVAPRTPSRTKAK